MQNLNVFKEVMDRAWGIRTWLSWQDISAEARAKLEEKIQAVEMEAWKMEKAEKDARRTAELEKEAAMSDAIPNGI